MCEYQSVPHNVYAFRFQGTWGDYRLIVHQIARLLPQSDLHALILFAPRNPDSKNDQFGDILIGENVVNTGDWLVVRPGFDPPMTAILTDLHFRQQYRPHADPPDRPAAAAPAPDAARSAAPGDAPGPRSPPAAVPER